MNNDKLEARQQFTERRDDVHEVLTRLNKLKLLSLGHLDVEKIISMIRGLEITSEDSISLSIDILNSHKDDIPRLLSYIVLRKSAEDISEKLRLFVEFRDRTLTLSFSDATCVDIDKTLEQYLRFNSCCKLSERDKALSVLYFEYRITSPLPSAEFVNRIAKAYEDLISKITNEVMRNIPRACISQPWISPRIADVVSINVNCLDKRSIYSLMKALTDVKSLEDLIGKLKEMGIEATCYKIVDRESAENIIKYNLKGGSPAVLVYKELTRGSMKWGSVYKHLLELVLGTETKEDARNIRDAVDSMSHYHRQIEDLVRMLAQDRDPVLTPLTNFLLEAINGGRVGNLGAEFVEAIYPLVPSVGLLLLYDIISSKKTGTPLLTKFQRLLEYVAEILAKSKNPVLDMIKDFTMQPFDYALTKLIQTINCLAKSITYEKVDSRGLHNIKLKVTHETLIGKNLGEVEIKIGRYVVVSRENCFYILYSPDEVKEVRNLIESLSRILQRGASSHTSSIQPSIEYTRSRTSIDPDIRSIVSSAIELALGIRTADPSSLRFIIDRSARGLALVRFDVPHSV